MGSTANYAFPYPDGSGKIIDGNESFKALADAIDAKVAANDYSGAWASYTPAVVNATQGAGSTMSGGYLRQGKTIHFWAKWVLGSGFSIAAGAGLTLPTAMRAVHSLSALRAVYTDTGSNIFAGLPYLSATTAVLCAVPGTNGNALALSATVPFTWAVTDIIDINGIYEAAA